MPVKTVIQLRRDTAADWDAAPSLLGRAILYEGEIGLELDTYRFKIGDGTTTWSDLDYFGASGVIGSGISGSGTANYLPIFTNNDTITDSIIYQSGTNIGIGTSTPNYKLQVNGTTRVDGGFSAVSKSFRIPHPSKENGELVYGSLESPYHGIRLTGKGKTQNGKCLVHLPYYIKDLVHSENYAIQITNFKHSKALFVNEVDISKNTFTIKVSKPKAGEELEFFWDFTAERKDIEKLQVEQ